MQASRTPASVAADHEGLEDLLGRHADGVGDVRRAEVVLVDFVLADFILERRRRRESGPRSSLAASGLGTIRVSSLTRRGGRVVDRARLESGSTFTGTGSSNLPLSASYQNWALRH